MDIPTTSRYQCPCGGPNIPPEASAWVVTCPLVAPALPRIAQVSQRFSLELTLAPPLLM